MLYRFYILNFEFPSFKNEFELSIGDYLIKIYKIDQYDKVIKILKENSSVLETAIFEINSQLEEDEITNFIHKMNNLFSICRSNIINFGRYFKFNDLGECVKEYFHTPISSDFSQYEIIPLSCFDDTINFINQGIKSYDKLNEEYNLNKIARESSIARSNLLFINTRGTILSILIEYIINKCCIHYGETNIIDDSLFTSKLESLSKKFYFNLEEIFKEQITPKEIKKLSSKLKIINDKSLDSKYSVFHKIYKCPITAEEIILFTKIRNSLAHTGNYSYCPNNNTPIDCYKFLMNIFERLVLSLFAYKGRYYNSLTESIEIFGAGS